ncbi:MAG TPA: amino-acid N-acetyltransferase [Porticoccaceae bacterium]|nr:amino-acid N-acetyltransferase [Porticoccaceae bacterium]HCO61321.1 amino-acid N-acetyltransferase [Porticoccaceae bacterium]
MSNYVKFFRDTSPYINMHRGKTFVLMLPGECVGATNFSHIIHDIALLNNLGIKIVLVHGARPQIDEKLAQRQLESSFNNHTRITDTDTMACVKDAVGCTAISIEALLSMSMANSPMQGSRLRVIRGNFITAKPLGVRGGVDFHHTGEVRRIDRAGIRRQLDEGSIVLLSPLGYSPTGEAFNLSSADVATQAAIALEAQKLICFSGQTGILDADKTLVKSINMTEVQNWLGKLKDQPPLHDALRAGYDACLNGVSRSHIISYTEDGALLQELFTREGSGTLLSHDGGEQLRQATIDDVGGVLELISPLEESGALVKRSRELLETEISRFQVIVHPEGMVIACAALYPFAGSDAGELACVVTHPDFHNRGLAARLLQSLENQANADFGLKRLFVLTTQASHWFKEQGFRESSLAELPAEKAALYNLQRNSRILVKPI